MRRWRREWHACGPRPKPRKRAAPSAPWGPLRCQTWRRTTTCGERLWHVRGVRHPVVAAGSAPFGQVRAGAHTHRQQPPAEDHPLGSRQSLQQPIHVLQRLARPQRPQPYLRSTLPELVNSAKARLDFYWLETSSGRIDLATQQIDFRTAHMQDLLVPGD
jgi:hypothetical protein